MDLLMYIKWHLYYQNKYDGDYYVAGMKNFHIIKHYYSPNQGTTCKQYIVSGNWCMPAPNSNPGTVWLNTVWNDPETCLQIIQVV